MSWLLPFIVGWCGTGWPFRWPRPKGGGGWVFDPDWPWPPNCIVCAGIIGGLSAVILEATLQPLIGDFRPGPLLAVYFFSGSFGASVVSGIGQLMTGKSNRMG